MTTDPSKAQYNEEYYRTGGYAGLNTGLAGKYFWARRFYAALVRRYCANGRVLEIGCGLGHVLARLQDRYDAYGIDISEYAVAQARANAPRAHRRCARSRISAPTAPTPSMR